MRRFPFIQIVLTFILLGSACFAQVTTNHRIGGQRFNGEVLINAKPQMVWTVLTDVKKFSKMMDFKYLGGAQNVNKVGDSAQLKVWDDVCMFVVSYVKPGSELRITLDPENASYICQKRWLLTPDGKGTRVKLLDRYTESGEQSQESLTAQVEEWDKALGRLKTMCEN